MAQTLTSSTHVSSTSFQSSKRAKPPVKSDVVEQSTPHETTEQPKHSEFSDQPNVVTESQEAQAQVKRSVMNMFRKSLDRSRRIGGEYKIVRKIDEGSYGIVYKVIDREGRFYAAKIAKSPMVGFALRTEQILIPQAIRGRKEGQVYSYYRGWHMGCRVVVMDLLGRSIKKQLLRYGHFSVHSVLLFGVQATSRIEQLHRRGYLHRDVKPSNFATGPNEDAGTIYLIDLGLTERFRTARCKRHVKKRTGYSFVGSKEFAARASHRGETQSRRCDLESLVYTMVFLREGSLPWTKRSEVAVAGMKEEISASQLCSKLPSEVEDYYRTVRSLDFDERPNYSKLRDLLVRAMERRGLHVQGKFDWER